MRSDSGDIYVQRVVADGHAAPGWKDAGVAACVAPGLQRFPVVVGDGEGGAVVAWQDERRAPDIDVYAQRVLVSGALAPNSSTEGVPLAVAPGRQDSPSITADGRGGAIATWVDYRNGNADVFVGRITFDQIVPTLLSLVRLVVSPEHVRLEWLDPRATVTRATVFRRSAESEWREVGRVSENEVGRLVFDDHAVSSGARLAYRLGVEGDAGFQYAAETWVEIPTSPALELAGPSPNPTTGDLMVSFGLPDAGAAKIEMLDLAGRVVMERDVGDLGGGRHEVVLSNRGLLSPGIYLLRLTHGVESRTSRAIVMR
jgi:hypothetical protein